MSLPLRLVRAMQAVVDELPDPLTDPTLAAAAAVFVDYIPTRPVRGQRSSLPQESKRTRAERQLRATVRHERLSLNPVCEGEARGVPHTCQSMSADRPEFEVHEIVARSLAPGSHLVLGMTATVCQWLHDALEDPGWLATVTDAPFVGGLVLPSSAVTFERDERVGRRLPRLRPEWLWARP